MLYCSFLHYRYINRLLPVLQKYKCFLQTVQISRNTCCSQVLVLTRCKAEMDRKLIYNYCDNHKFIIYQEKLSFSPVKDSPTFFLFYAIVNWNIFRFLIAAEKQAVSKHLLKLLVNLSGIFHSFLTFYRLNNKSVN